MLNILRREIIRIKERLSALEGMVVQRWTMESDEGKEEWEDTMPSYMGDLFDDEDDDERR